MPSSRGKTRGSRASSSKRPAGGSSDSSSSPSPSEEEPPQSTQRRRQQQAPMGRAPASPDSSSNDPTDGDNQESDDECCACGDGGNLVLCEADDVLGLPSPCPRAMHAHCAGFTLVHEPGEPEPKWVCPQHTCVVTGTNETAADTDPLWKCSCCSSAWRQSCLVEWARCTDVSTLLPRSTDTAIRECTLVLVSLVESCSCVTDGPLMGDKWVVARFGDPTTWVCPQCDNPHPFLRVAFALESAILGAFSQEQSQKKLSVFLAPFSDPQLSSVYATGAKSSSEWLHVRARGSVASTGVASAAQGGRLAWARRRLTTCFTPLCLGDLLAQCRAMRFPSVRDARLALTQCGSLVEACITNFAGPPLSSSADAEMPLDPQPHVPPDSMGGHQGTVAAMTSGVMGQLGRVRGSEQGAAAVGDGDAPIHLTAGAIPKEHQQTLLGAWAHVKELLDKRFRSMLKDPHVIAATQAVEALQGFANVSDVLFRKAAEGRSAHPVKHTLGDLAASLSHLLRSQAAMGLVESVSRQALSPQAPIDPSVSSATLRSTWQGSAIASATVSAGPSGFLRAGSLVFADPELAFTTALALHDAFVSHGSGDFAPMFSGTALGVPGVLPLPPLSVVPTSKLSLQTKPSAAPTISSREEDATPVVSSSVASAEASSAPVSARPPHVDLARLLQRSPHSVSMPLPCEPVESLFVGGKANAHVTSAPCPPAPPGASSAGTTAQAKRCSLEVTDDPRSPARVSFASSGLTVAISLPIGGGGSRRREGAEATIVLPLSHITSAGYAIRRALDGKPPSMVPGLAGNDPETWLSIARLPVPEDPRVAVYTALALLVRASCPPSGWHARAYCAMAPQHYVSKSLTEWAVELGPLSALPKASRGRDNREKYTQASVDKSIAAAEAASQGGGRPQVELQARFLPPRERGVPDKLVLPRLRNPAILGSDDAQDLMRQVLEWDQDTGGFSRGSIHLALHRATALLAGEAAAEMAASRPGTGIDLATHALDSVLSTPWSSDTAVFSRLLREFCWDEDKSRPFDVDFAQFACDPSNQVDASAWGRVTADASMLPAPDSLAVARPKRSREYQALCGTGGDSRFPCDAVAWQATDEILPEPKRAKYIGGASSSEVAGCMPLPSSQLTSTVGAEHWKAVTEIARAADSGRDALVVSQLVASPNDLAIEAVAHKASQFGFLPATPPPETPMEEAEQSSRPNQSSSSAAAASVTAAVAVPAASAARGGPKRPQRVANDRSVGTDITEHAALEAPPSNDNGSSSMPPWARHLLDSVLALSERVEDSEMRSAALLADAAERWGPGLLGVSGGHGVMATVMSQTANEHPVTSSSAHPAMRLASEQDEAHLRAAAGTNASEDAVSRALAVHALRTLASAGLSETQSTAMDASALLPPGGQEVGDLFDSLSRQLRRALREVATLRTAWEASRRALMGVHTTQFPGQGSVDGNPPAGPVITLGEGRLAAEVAAANRALRARLQAQEKELAVLRARLTKQP
jgi:hypothetical protein